MKLKIEQEQEHVHEYVLDVDHAKFKAMKQAGEDLPFTKLVKLCDSFDSNHHAAVAALQHRISVMVKDQLVVEFEQAVAPFVAEPFTEIPVAYPDGVAVKPCIFE